MKTLQQIKDDHAKELGFTDFEEMFSEATHTGVDYCVDAIAIKYANQKLDQAADHSQEMIYEIEKAELNDNGLILRKYQHVYATVKQYILSFKDPI